MDCNWDIPSICASCVFGNSRDDENHYSQQNCPPRPPAVIGRYNVHNVPLVDPHDVFLPPLHIKLGLMKNFVKALKKESGGFAYLREIFGFKSDAKLKEGVFIGPEIRKIINDHNFRSKLDILEKNALDGFVAVVKQFLGKQQAANYVDIVENMLSAYHAMGARMSLKCIFYIHI